MSDVLLRECVEEMRDKLHEGKYSDVLALGRHILHFYPKHIETYTLLGQASLETNDVAGATDIYRRVLSADPENVLALAGMALLAESQDKHDDALWYLERAYEIQPSNDELRRELGRAREAYYGTTAARLELTPGALARVYARQGQYSQAVNEFRRLLKNESQRYDARVALAETLYRAGRNDEAAQLAQQVMADAPYSLKPNLILGALWSENAVPEGERFLERAAALDPENRVARDLLGERFAPITAPSLPPLGETESAGTAETVPADDEAVRIAHLMQEIEREQEQESEYAATAALLDPVTPPVQAVTSAAAAPEQEHEKAVAGAAALGLGAIAAAIAKDKAEEKQADAPVAPAAAVTAAATAQEETTPIENAAPAEAASAGVVSAEAKPRAPGKPVPTDAIAAAAAALAASIVLDKNNQPAPARRGNPAIPKVRPVIRSAQDKLPAWLRLGSTPSAASASFDAPSPDEADLISPLTAASAGAAASKDDRPDWLVQAQAAAQESSEPPAGTDLPDWLGTPPPAATTAMEATVSSATVEDKSPETPAAVELPSWLRDDTATDPSKVPPVATVAAAAAMPDWLSEKEITQATAPAAAANEEVTEDWTNASPSGEESTPSAVASAVNTVPGAARAEAVDDTPKTASPKAEAEPPATTEPEPAAPPTQVMPDSATMLGMAREKRANGDVKGALDLYERVMHRRPNHLDEVIGDLKEITTTEGASSASHRLLGEAFAMAGRFKESLEQYRIAMGK